MIKKKKTKKSGVCQLTGDFGPFQQSHILPKAVTKLSDNGERYRETSLNTRPVWRSNSWYDYNLVTAKGEKILSEIDDLAISELRKHKLIWSGFGPKWKNSPTSYRLDEPVRTVSGLNTKLVRLFFISLLWRAAASQREEMSDIYLPQQELDVLKLMIVRKESGEPGFLPMYINQISNIGVHHNRTPIYEKQVIGDIEVDTFRFYFEGLICHIIHSYDGDIIKGLEPVFIEASSELLVITHKFEDSRAFSDLKEVISSSFDECS